MAYTCNETEYPIEHYQQQEEWNMNTKFPQKQNSDWESGERSPVKVSLALMAVS